MKNLKLAGSFSADPSTGQVEINGEPFAYYLAPEGIDVHVDQDGLSTVTISVLVDGPVHIDGPPTRITSGSGVQIRTVSAE